MQNKKEKKFKEIKDRIKKAKKILLLTHRAPDGDGIGAMLALYSFLKSKRKKVFLFSSTPPKYLSFLKNYDKIQKKNFKEKNFDLVFALDYADDRRIDFPPNLEIQEEKIISIDHHLNGKMLGNLSYLDSKALSVCEIIYEFLIFNKAKITKDIAESLLVGIFTDTVGFGRMSSKRTKKIVIELLTKGAEIEKIVSFYYKVSFAQAKLMEKVLSRLKVDKKLKLVYSWLSFSDFSEVKEIQKKNGEKTELFLQEPPIFPDFLAKIGEEDVYLFLIKMKKDKIKASLRAKSRKINVARIAEKMGGGGHKEASGFFTEGKSLNEVIEIVKKELRRLKKK